LDYVQIAISILEIAIIAIMINYLLSFLWNTRAMDVVLGLLAFLAIFAVASWLRFPVLEKILYYLLNAAGVAILVIFQPELRLALSKLGTKGRKYREITEFDNFLEALSQSVYRQAEKRVGSLILLENHDSLEEFANQAVLLNARFSSELLETIFMPTTPLHDGAVIIRGTTILSAATILPLADDSQQLTKSMGTRHRAGLGISQRTDALVVVVSEESGKVSIARDGIMTRGVKADRFKAIVRSVFSPPQPSKAKRFTWRIG
jgi:uncharacterized protein (TIGR00159 family)